MKWKKLLFVVALAGMAVLAMAGCSKTEESVPATMEQTTPAVERTIPATGGTIPAPPGGGAQGERPPAPVMDLAAAAAKLGLTEQQLSEALGDLSQGPLNLAAAAAKLSVSEDSLHEALGLPAGVPSVGGPPPGGLPPAGSGPTGQGQ